MLLVRGCMEPGGPRAGLLDWWGGFLDDGGPSLLRREGGRERAKEGGVGGPPYPVYSSDSRV